MIGHPDMVVSYVVLGLGVMLFGVALVSMLRVWHIASRLRVIETYHVAQCRRVSDVHEEVESLVQMLRVEQFHVRESQRILKETHAYVNSIAVLCEPDSCVVDLTRRMREVLAERD